MIFHNNIWKVTKGSMSFTVTSGYFHKEVYEGIEVKDGN